MDESLILFFKSLIPKLFKVLPLAGIYKDHLEQKSSTYYEYMNSLSIEMTGAIKTFDLSSNDYLYMKYIMILNIVNYLGDSAFDISEHEFRKEIFKSINVLKNILVEIEGD